LLTTRINGKIIKKDMASKIISPMVKVARQVCPAVITIVVTKDLSRVEGYYFVPMGDQQMLVPKMDKQEKAKSAAAPVLLFRPMAMF